METIAFKTTDGDFIRQQAAARKTSVSEFIRATIAALKPKQACKITGRPGRVIIVHPPGAKKITDADLDAAMANMDEEYLMGKAL